MQLLCYTSVASVACLLTLLCYNEAYGQQNHTSATTPALFDQSSGHGNVLKNYTDDKNLMRNSTTILTKNLETVCSIELIFSLLFTLTPCVVMVIQLCVSGALAIVVSGCRRRLIYENVKTICCEFTAELAEFKRRYATAYGTGGHVSAHMIAQLTDIRQRLFHRVNAVRARYRRKTRDDKQSSGYVGAGCGIACIYLACVMWSYVAFEVATTILCTNTKKKHLGLELFWFIIFVVMPLPVITLCMSKNKLFWHKPVSIKHARQQIQAILDEPPYLRFCDKKDCPKMSNDKICVRCKPNKHVSKMLQYLKYWRNEAKNFLADIHKRKLTVINVRVEIQYDENCGMLDQVKQYFVDHSYNTVIIAGPGAAGPKWLISSYCFCFLTCICLGWLYNILLLFKYSETEYEYTIVKRIYSKKPKTDDYKSPNTLSTFNNIFCKLKIENERTAQTDTIITAPNSMSEQLNSIESEVTSMLTYLERADRNLIGFDTEPLTAESDDDYFCLTFNNINKLQKLTPTPAAPAKTQEVCDNSIAIVNKDDNNM